MSEPKKKTGVQFWATIVIMALVAYPLSIGPSCWMVVKVDELGNDDRVSSVVGDDRVENFLGNVDRVFDAIYAPIIAVGRRSKPVHDALGWYCGLFFRGSDD